MRRIGVPYLNYTTMKHLLTSLFLFSGVRRKSTVVKDGEEDSTSVSLLASLVAFHFADFLAFRLTLHLIFLAAYKTSFLAFFSASFLAFFSTFLYCLSTSRATFAFIATFASCFDLFVFHSVVDAFFDEGFNFRAVPS